MRVTYLSLCFALLLPSLNGITFNSLAKSLHEHESLVVQIDSRSETFARKEIAEIKDSCLEALNSASKGTLRQLGKSLIEIAPSEKTFSLGIEFAEALIACRAPHSAQQILANINPISHQQKTVWLILSWQAADAAMDHESAAIALRKLADGNLQTLDTYKILVRRFDADRPLTQSALDLLAEHEIANGSCDAALRVLLAGRASQEFGIKRISLIHKCLDRVTINQRKILLNQTLESAQRDKAWWLVAEILRIQLSFEYRDGGDGLSIRERIEEVAKKLDDRYMIWNLIRNEPLRRNETNRLENQLRSPRVNPPIPES